MKITEKDVLHTATLANLHLSPEEITQTAGDLENILICFNKLQDLDTKEIYSKDLVSSVLERIENIDSRINAYITIAKDTALKQAEAADEKMAFQSEYR